MSNSNSSFLLGFDTTAANQSTMLTFRCEMWPDVYALNCITLHLKISCPSSPSVPMGRGMSCPVPQVKIEMESDYDSDSDRHRPRDVSSETTL